MAGINIISVQFRRAGKIYDFDAKDLLLSVGEKVVVETERGPSLAEVKRISYVFPGSRDTSHLKPVLRIANKKDLESSGRLTAESAHSFCVDRIKALNLDMRLISADVQFGGNKVIFYFSAPGRVDFRELVKELASGLKTRVELKQVGARDETKLVGGVGICGREFCCSSFLREFVPVSIKMAKNQNLALNPSKVSGGCGRLLCCLTYEDDVYKELRQKLLPKRTRVRLPDGTLGDVIKGDVLNQVMMIETDRGEQVSVPISDLEVVEKDKGVSSDWGDDLDLDSLMGSEDAEALAALDEEFDGAGRKNSAPAKPEEKRPQHGQRHKDRGRDGKQQHHQHRDRPQHGQGQQQRPHGGQQGQGRDGQPRQQSQQQQQQQGEGKGRNRRGRRNRNKNKNRSPKE